MASSCILLFRPESSTSRGDWVCNRIALKEYVLPGLEGDGAFMELQVTKRKALEGLLEKRGQPREPFTRGIVCETISIGTRHREFFALEHLQEEWISFQLLPES